MTEKQSYIHVPDVELELELDATTTSFKNILYLCQDG